MLHKISTRVMKLLTRRGTLVEEQVATTMAENEASSDDARAPRPLQAAAWADAAARRARTQTVQWTGCAWRVAGPVARRVLQRG